MKSFRSIAGIAALLIAVFALQTQFGTYRLAKQVSRLQEEKARLTDYIGRLSASRRVAQVEVLSQCIDAEGRTVSELRWQEVRPDGLVGPPVEVHAVGFLAYFEAAVIKFEREHVGNADPGRSSSLVLFRRVFGDQQAPESVRTLDQNPPALTSSGSVENGVDLWERFLELVESPELAAQYGVRVAQFEAPAVPIRNGQLWEVTLDAAGGLNLKVVRPGDEFVPIWCPPTVEAEPDALPKT